jgi:hypothetical protein
MRNLGSVCEYSAFISVCVLADPPKEIFIGYDVFYRPDTPGVAGTSGVCTFHRWGIWQYDDPREAFHIT